MMKEFILIPKNMFGMLSKKKIITQHSQIQNKRKKIELEYGKHTYHHHNQHILFLLIKHMTHITIELI